jgi:phospholipid/cholesterol/gamma-HCH transport system permease protein
MATEPGWLSTDWDGSQWMVMAGGRWTLAGAETLLTAVDRVKPPKPAVDARIDLSGLATLDTAGALLIERLLTRLRGEGHAVIVVGLRPELCGLLKEVRLASRMECPGLPPERPFLDLVAKVGESTFDALRHCASLLSFLGMVSLTALRLFRSPNRFRWKPFAFHLEQVGLNALPIVGLLAFLIGVVLAYQAADQLKQFGVEIFVVNLLGIGILREIGILITSIIVAGRTGSAFTAQIGTMKVNQEVDAMQTLGLDPIEVLVLPRVFALMIALPLLAFYANIVALFGGAVMAYLSLDITFGQFLKQLQIAVNVDTLMVGMVKAPVFAAVIAMVGCYEGMQVSGSAESVGQLTTRAVVVGIFLVIVLDALFSVLFSFLGI